MQELMSEGLEKEEFLDVVLSYNSNADIKKIGAAYDFAKTAHEGQKRESGRDFFMHVKECAYLIATMKLDTEAICAALLHDILEDTKTKPEVIEKKFGKEVLQLVQGVTKEISSKAMRNPRAENLRKMLLATAKDVRVIMIKLADRLHNMRTLKYLPVQSQKEIAKETLEIYVPIAYKLGMYRIKSELEDLCLKHLQPEIYQQLKQKIVKKKMKREKDVNRIIIAVRKLLGEEGIDSKVYGRAKNFYAIYKKMMKKSLKFEEIRDLSAVRIIVKTPEDCYKALNAIHSKWQPITNGFDDYIKNPKPNLYQSLHTEILFNKKTVEVQIRTHEMHHVAEEGIAAHWQYKETERDKKFDRKIGWLKQILDWRSAETAQDLVESFKIDIFKDEIYVVTPKGDPIPLPEKSTPVDFAYAVHTEIGDFCKAAKINGKIQSLDYELKSGDVVEIITAKNAKPSRQWLQFVKTSFAREKIRKAAGIKGEPTKKVKDITTTKNMASKEKLPLRLQKCCYIRQGDLLLGQKTKEAILVHSKYCDVAKRIPQNKKVKIGWIEQKHKKQLEIELKDETGIFADILSTLTSDDIKVNTINTKSAKNNLRMMLQISTNDEQLEKTMPKLKRVKNVISVKAT
ncbi:(p)ppGpp synthetase [Candidatus Woesearchaeota archaeon]|nr:(p)ppGpp synthetase [Candidatus Woesearchaeota archaeon]|tara:strand:+ start:6684 stop:8564 length:1881 start_codon:yes stop_codon:yes gene_type:complete